MFQVMVLTVIRMLPVIYTDILDSPLLVVKVHSLLHLVVGSYSEWDDLHGGEAWSHGEDLASMCGVIQILFGLRVRHTCRVPADDVEV